MFQFFFYFIMFSVSFIYIYCRHLYDAFGNVMMYCLSVLFLFAVASKAEFSLCNIVFLS